MRAIAALSTIVLIASAVLAQRQDVPPPPRPPDDGPSLEETMKFIQKHLNGEGAVGETTTVRNQFSYSVDEVSREFSDASADTATCKLSFRLSTRYAHRFHPEEGVEDPATSASDSTVYELSLRDVDKVQVLSAAEHRRHESARRGDPVPEVSTDAYIILVYLLRGKKLIFRSHSTTLSRSDFAESGTSDGPLEFYFHGEDLAKRMGKAMVHAVELCGGGQEKEEKEPF